jgi:tRNA A37 threonylcarbamoyladenosine dehydratase
MQHEGSSGSPEKRFARTAEFFGPEGFDRIRNASVAVVGLGGVGSHAAVCLARNGIGDLLLIDFDVVTESSLNRSPFAGPSSVGLPKAEVLARHLAEVSSGTRVRWLREFMDGKTIADALTFRPSWVVDAIDSLNPKVCLIQHCLSSSIPIVSSMGASSRIDPSAVRVDDISKTGICPLARKVRQYLRRRGVESGLTCVYSIETPAVRPGPPDDSEQLVRRGRVRNRLPGAGALPGIFGYACAAVVLKGIAGG